MSGRRSLAPVLRWSLVAHVGAVAAVAARSGWWPWLAAALVADHALLVAAGLLPRCALLGPNLRRLLSPAREVALTFDDGPDPATTPAVLDLLDAAGARATFFVVGRRAEAHPELVREVVRRGHRLGNHTHRHPAGFAFLPPAALRREIGRAQGALAELAAAPPRWFRAPAGIRSPWLEPVLASLGLGLVSWTRRGFDTVSGDPDRVADRLLDGLAAGDILLLHDGGGARTPDGGAVVLRALERVLGELDRRGLGSVALPEPSAGRSPFHPGGRGNGPGSEGRGRGPTRGSSPRCTRRTARWGRP